MLDGIIWSEVNGIYHDGPRNSRLYSGVEAFDSAGVVDIYSVFRKWMMPMRLHCLHPGFYYVCRVGEAGRYEPSYRTRRKLDVKWCISGVVAADWLFERLINSKSGCWICCFSQCWRRKSFVNASLDSLVGSHFIYTMEGIFIWSATILHRLLHLKLDLRGVERVGR